MRHGLRSITLVLTFTCTAAAASLSGGCHRADGSALPLDTGTDASSTASSSSGGAAEPDITGRWTSECLPQPDGTFARLDFDIDASAWALDYDVFGDQSCSFALVTVHIAGSYALTGPSPAVDGAHEARFGFDAKTITPHADPILEALDAAGCGDGAWMLETSQSVASGCAAFGQYPIADCPADHDLVQIEGDTLRFGARPADNDMCTPARRPTDLSPVALHRT